MYLNESIYYSIETGDYVVNVCLKPTKITLIQRYKLKCTKVSKGESEVEH